MFLIPPTSVATHLCTDWAVFIGRDASAIMTISERS